MTIPKKSQLIQALKMYSGQDLAEIISVKNMKGSSIVPVEVSRNFETKTIIQDVKIPASEVTGGSILAYKLKFIDSSNRVVGESKKTYNFGASLNAIEIPRVRPGATVDISNTGKVTMTYIQNDPMASSIKVYYKNTLGSPYKEVYNVKAKKGDSGQVFLPDQMSLQMASRYDGIVRAVAFSENGTPGAFIDSTIPQPPPQLNYGKISNAWAHNINGTLSIKKVDEGIYISAKTNILPMSTKGVGILKREYIVGENGLVSKEAETYIEVGQSKTFADQEVKDGHYYEYSLVCGEYGEAQSGEIISQIETIYFKSKPDWVTCSVQSKRMGPIAVGYTPSYRLESNNLSSSMLKFLSTYGIKDLYEDDLKSIRDRLGLFFIFKVTRKDEFGNRKDIGYCKPGSLFEDPFKIASSAQYRFQLFGINKGAMIENIKRNPNGSTPYYLFEDVNSSENTFDNTLSVNKSLFNIGNSNSYSSLSSAGSSLGLESSLIDTGCECSIGNRHPRNSEIAVTAGAKPATSITLSRISGKINRVTWSGIGKDSVDHYIIISKSNNSVSIAGTVSHIPTIGNTYAFYDNRFAGAIGTVSYGIISVSLGFKITKPSYSNEIKMV
jgi:hypothetical protein